MIWTSRQMQEKVNRGQIKKPVWFDKNVEVNALIIWPFWIEAHSKVEDHSRFLNDDTPFWDAIGGYGFVGARTESEAILIDGILNM